MLKGEDVLEIDFGGTGASELMRGILKEHYVYKDGRNEKLPFKEKKKTGGVGAFFRKIFSIIPGIWSTEERNAYVERYNKKAKKNRDEVVKAYGQPVTLTENGKNRTFRHIKRKDLKNTATNATKTRYTMAGPNIINFGEYDLDNLEKYALTLGSEWLYPRLMEISKRVGDKKVPPDIKKLHVMFQGHSRGGVAATMAAMRLNKWIYDHFEEKIAKLVQFDLVIYDPVPGKFSRTGIREIADFDTNSYYDKDGNVTTDIDKAKYRSLRDQQNTTVIYTLRTFANHFFTPQQIHGAKRVIISVRDHNVFSYERSNALDADKTIHRSPYINLDSNEAYRGSGINDIGFKEFIKGLPELLEMPGGSDFLEDYRNPLVQKQFTDQIRELMDSEKISRSEAEAKVLSKRRRDFKKKPMEITKSDSLVPVMPAPVINELSKKQGLFAGMTDKDWESKGGCSYTHVLDIKEAERIEKKSEGFLCSSRLETAPGEIPHTGLRVLRPSLPEKMTINNREIKVRRTYNLFIKTFINLITNPDGSFDTSGKYMQLVGLFDDITMMMSNPKVKQQQRRRKSILKNLKP